MTIETKYNIGDEVWFISNNKPVCSKIQKPHFTADYSNKKEYNLEEMLGWQLEYMEYGFGCEFPANRLETELFKTKEELIASL
jgi:hypothetical protein